MKSSSRRTSWLYFAIIGARGGATPSNDERFRGDDVVVGWNVDDDAS